MLLSLFVGVLCFAIVLLCSMWYHFWFCNHLAEEERAGCFNLVIFFLSCGCWCSVSLPHCAVGWSFHIRESPPQFENIMARVYVRSIMCSMYYVPNSPILFARNGTVKISSVACGFSPVKVNYSDYPKSFISRINKVFFSIKYCYSIFFFTTFIVEC